jgi:hypothetical protein
MKRQICSYDMVAVPSGSYTVTDAEGDMYLCNSRCLCIWAVMLVTKHNLPESERDRSYGSVRGAISNDRPYRDLTEQCGHETLSRFLGSGRVTGNPHLTRRWPFGRVTEGLPTIRELSNEQSVCGTDQGVFPGKRRYFNQF